MSGFQKANTLLRRFIYKDASILCDPDVTKEDKRILNKISDIDIVNWLYEHPADNRIVEELFKQWYQLHSKIKIKGVDGTMILSIMNSQQDIMEELDRHLNNFKIKINCRKKADHEALPPAAHQFVLTNLKIKN